MSYDVTVFGELRFPRGKFRAWRELVVDTKRLGHILKLFSRAPDSEPASVEEIAKDLPRAGGRGLFELREDKGIVEVRGRLTAAAFERRKRQLVAMFVLAAELGTEGEVSFVGEGVWTGYRVRLRKGRAIVEPLTPEEVSQAAMHPALDAISEYFRVEPGMQTPPPFDPTGQMRPMLEMPRGQDDDVERLFLDAVWSEEEAMHSVAMRRLEILKPIELGERALQALMLDPVSWTNDVEPRNAVAQVRPLLRIVRLLLVIRYAPAMDNLLELWQLHPWKSVRDGVASCVRESDPSVLGLLGSS